MGIFSGDRFEVLSKWIFTEILPLGAASRAARLRSRLAEGVEAPARHGRAEHVEGAGVRAADGDRAVDSRPRRHVLDNDLGCFVSRLANRLGGGSLSSNLRVHT